MDKRPPHIRRIRIDWRCAVCRECTDAMGEYFMVQHNLWRAAILGLPKQQTRMVRTLSNGAVTSYIVGSLFLCIGCLESRLGRQLVPADFLDCRCNERPTSSRRLAQRSGRPYRRAA